MKTRHGYHVAMRPELLPTDGWCYMAHCIEWPECYAQGTTPFEALDILNDVIDDFRLLSIGDELGYPLPYGDGISVGAAASIVMTFDLAVKS